jgi:hypothetical protein
LPEAVEKSEKTPASAWPAPKVEARRITARGIIPTDFLKRLINEGFFDEPDIFCCEGKISLVIVSHVLVAYKGTQRVRPDMLNAYKA